ncbi:MAG: hypothetical protein IH991_16945 [Planctomycetes bacterium]|nr:hypothetical protein [Planctomycetota bacterium]
MLLRCTTIFAAQGGDAGFMMKAVDEVDRHFEIDRLEIGQEALLRFADAARSENAVASLVNTTTRFIDEAIAADRVDLASELADSVYSVTLKKQFAIKFRKQMNDQRKQVSELYSQWKKIRDAQALLKTNPDDASANLVIGKWHCFEKNDWEAGLLHLAKSNDTLLSSLAKRETTTPPETTKDQIALADAWWEAAQSASSTDRLGFVTRAARWYRLAQPEVTSSIEKLKIEKRLNEFSHFKSVQPDRGRPIDLLRLIDPAKHTVLGQWSKVRGGLMSSPQETSVVWIPLESVPREYDLTVIVARLKNNNTFAIGVVFGDHRTLVALNAHNGKFSGFEKLDGKFLHENETTTRKGMILPGGPHEIVIRVRQAGISVEFDRELIINWKGNGDRLSTTTKPPAGRLFLYTSKTTYGVSQVMLKPISQR